MSEISGVKKTRYRLMNEPRSLLGKYQEMVVGRKGLFSLLYHELVISLFSYFPGGLGFMLRRLFYYRLLGELGRGVILGRGVTLRWPNRIRLGHRVAVDDGCLIDGRGSEERGATIGDEVIIGRYSVIQAKYGPIEIGPRTEIGPQCVMSAASQIVVGQKVLIAARCYIGGGVYHAERTDIPIIDQGTYSKGPVIIEDDVWLGAGVIVIDGVRIGKGSIISPGSVVTRDIPRLSVAAGIPARVVRQRQPVSQYDTLAGHKVHTTRESTSRTTG